MTTNSGLDDVMLGSLVTLGNPKAILFYSALLPAFFNVNLLVTTDILAICSVITLVSFFVYGIYMTVATEALKATRNANMLKRIQLGSGLTLIGTGVFIAARE